MDRTPYAPAGRASPDRLRTETESLLKDGPLATLFEAVNDILLVLNPERQIVYFNHNFLRTLELTEGTTITGLRPGEALGCIHSTENTGGCGTTEFCRECGAVNAILEAQQGLVSIRECRILRRGAEALDLLVKASPYPIDGQAFTIFTVTDVSHEKRRKALERIFFHDVMNAAGGIQGLTELMPQLPEESWAQIAGLLQTSAETLVGEIRSQRELSEAENNELKVHLRTVTVSEVLDTVDATCRKHPVCEGKDLAIRSTDGELTTDPVLLARILGNLVKNALEASLPGDTVTVTGRSQKGIAVFEVHNPGVIPLEVQHQLFQRSFSTKGSDRGLGTYSVKLLTERYLGGRVHFDSLAERGTTFRVVLG